MSEKEHIVTKPHPGGIAAAVEEKRIDGVFQRRLPAGLPTFVEQVAEFDRTAPKADFAKVDEYPSHTPSAYAKDPELYVKVTDYNLVEHTGNVAGLEYVQFRQEDEVVCAPELRRRWDVAEAAKLMERNVVLEGPGDMVNSPSHYTHGDGLETIDAIKQALGTEGFLAYCRGNVLKYIWRAGHKHDTTEDLAKAVWYCRMAAGDDPREDS